MKFIFPKTKTRIPEDFSQNLRKNSSFSSKLLPHNFVIVDGILFQMLFPPPQKTKSNLMLLLMIFERDVTLNSLLTQIVLPCNLCQRGRNFSRNFFCWPSSTVCFFANLNAFLSLLQYQWIIIETGLIRRKQLERMESVKYPLTRMFPTTCSTVISARSTCGTQLPLKTIWRDELIR